MRPALLPIVPGAADQPMAPEAGTATGELVIQAVLFVCFGEIAAATGDAGQEFKALDPRAERSAPASSTRPSDRLFRAGVSGRLAAAPLQPGSSLSTLTVADRASAAMQTWKGRLE
jgi:hypothetical protein